MPPKKILFGGFPTPYTTFCLICTITGLTYFPIRTTNEWAGVDIRWFSVDGFDTRWIPRNFQCRTIQMWGMCNAYVRHDSFTCVMWLVHMWDTTHLHVWCDFFKFIYEARLLHMWDTTPSYVGHECTGSRETRRIHTWEWMMHWHTRVKDALAYTRLNDVLACESHDWMMRWHMAYERQWCTGICETEWCAGI